MTEEELEAIATASGGTYLPIERADEILDRLRADTTRQSSVIARPIKSRTWLPAIFLFLLTLEWVLRKRSNMA